MANTCFNLISFYSKENNKDALLLFENKLKKLDQNKNITLIDFYKELTNLTIDEIDRTLEGRGQLQSISYNDDRIEIEFESAWTPVNKDIEKIAILNNLNSVCLAEENGCDIFLNTDTEGLFYDSQYQIDCCLKDTEEEYYTEYFNSLEQMLDFCRNTLYLDFNTFEELENFCDNFESDDDEEFISLHDFSNE